MGAPTTITTTTTNKNPNHRILPTAKALADADVVLLLVKMGTFAADWRSEVMTQLVTEKQQRIEKMWQEQISELPAVAFVRRKHLYVNAIAPCRSIAMSDICTLRFDQPNQPLTVVTRAKMYDMDISVDARTLFYAAGKIHEIAIDPVTSSRSAFFLVPG